MGDVRRTRREDWKCAETAQMSVGGCLGMDVPASAQMHPEDARYPDHEGSFDLRSGILNFQAVRELGGGWAIWVRANR